MTNRATQLKERQVETGEQKGGYAARHTLPIL
jgi:hypothetical protein